jgi:hypothetical protein
MSHLTKSLSRLIGLYLMIIALAMAAHRQAFVDTITAMVHDAPVVLLSGIVAVVIGLAIVLNHNVWSGGAAPVIVTLAGWIALIKGVLLLFLSPGAESAVFLDGMHFAQLSYMYCAIAFLLGAYLTERGFRAA